MLAQRAVWEDPRWTRAVEDRLDRPHCLEMIRPLLCVGSSNEQAWKDHLQWSFDARRLGFTQAAFSVSCSVAAVGSGNERAWRDHL